MNNLTLIHYGSKEYNKNYFRPIKNINHITFSKPAGGLWVSPIDARFGWKDWCRESNYGNLTNSFKLKFKKNTKIYIINKYIDLVKLPLINPFYISQNVNWEEVSKKYDAVWLTDRGERLTSNLSLNLNLHGWDCESILILNPNCIYQIN